NASDTDWREMNEQFQEVFDYAASRGWDLQIIDSFTKSEADTRRKCYAIRYREREGTLVEGVLECHWDGLRLAKELRMTPDVARGVLDKNVRTDCRKCGTSILPGSEQCPYCRAWRHELRIA